MKKIITILFFSIFLFSEISADITSQLLKLTEMYNSGKINKEEFEKTKSILLKINQDEDKNQNTNKIKDIIQVNTYEDHIKFFEKKELIFDDYRIYTHRPGGLKIRRLSDNKQLAVFSDKFKIKYYNDGEGLFDFILDEKKGKIFLKFKGVDLLKWEGEFIKKHQAHFFQILTYNDEPFHYYIILKGGKPVALNIKKFQKKITKSINEVKIKLAAKYNITLEQIELILNKQKKAKNKEIEKAVGKTKEEYAERVLRASIDEAIQESIGDAMAKEFQDAIIEGMEDELVAAVNEAVAEAVSAGISEAAAEAGIRAAIEVLAAGGSEQEAWDAGCAAAGQESGC